VRAALEVRAAKTAWSSWHSANSSGTGYGYIERMGDPLDSKGFPFYAVRRFTEKPALSVAKVYAGSGDYHWNAGMFFWRASTFLANLISTFRKTLRCFGVASRQYREVQLRNGNSARFIPSCKIFRWTTPSGTCNPRTWLTFCFLSSRRGRLERYRFLAAVYELLSKHPGDNILPRDAYTLDATGQSFLERFRNSLPPSASMILW